MNSDNWRYLNVDDLIQIATRLGAPDVRDLGLLDSAAHRPQATVFGQDAYPDLPTKAAALMCSIARNHAMIDGNKRLAWAGARVFCRMNGHDLRAPSTDAAYDLVISVATGAMEVDEVAPVLAEWIVPFEK